MPFQRLLAPYDASIPTPRPEVIELPSSSSFRLLLLLVLELLRLYLLQPPFLVESGNLSLQLSLLHLEVVACDLEVTDHFFGRGLLVAFALLLIG